MNESAVYNESDVAPFDQRLQELRGIVQHDFESGRHPKPLTTLLERLLNECGVFPSMAFSPPGRFTSVPLDLVVKQLQDSLAILDIELVPVHQKLVAIRRQLVALAAKEEPHKAELKPLQEELRKIDSHVFSLDP